MARYVILEHDHPVRHWDFMLEVGEVLRTWRLAEPPAAGATVRAEPISDHRRLYLDYKGAVSGNRGTVKRWDAGTFTWIADEKERIAVRLEGQRSRGLVTLRRGSADAWSLVLDDSA
jgi:hypothetical protein